MRKNQNGFAHLVLLLIIIVVITVIGFAGWQVYKTQHRSKNQNVGYNSPSSGNGSDSGSPVSSLPACSGSNLLDHLPADESAFTGVEPLGHMNGGHVLPSQGDHVYFDMQPAGGNTSQSTNVYSPGNVTLVQLTQAKIASSGHSDYALFFAPCKNVIFEYGHVQELSSQLTNAIASSKPTCSSSPMVENCMYMNLSVKLTSGESVGTAGGPNFNGNAFDFGASDDRTKPLAFIDTSSTVQTGVIEMSGNNSYQHAVCPLDYFSSSIKSYLYGHLSVQNGGANGIPACGSSMQDKPGTSQGDWYKQGATGASGQGLDIAGALAIAHFNMDPTYGEISVGTDLVPSQWGGTQLIFKPTHSGYINREPSEIKPDGHIYCFDGTDGATLVAQGNKIHFDAQLTDTNSLKIDYGAGSCAAAPNLSSPTTFAR